ncbi:hypothetical protein AB6A23_19130 [Paenibacillus tarimensis]
MPTKLAVIVHKDPAATELAEPAPTARGVHGAIVRMDPAADVRAETREDSPVIRPTGALTLQQCDTPDESGIGYKYESLSHGDRLYFCPRGWSECPWEDYLSAESISAASNWNS